MAKLSVDMTSGKVKMMVMSHCDDAQEPRDGEVEPLCWPMAPLPLSLGNPEMSKWQ